MTLTLAEIAGLSVMAAGFALPLIARFDRWTESIRTQT